MRDLRAFGATNALNARSRTPLRREVLARAAGDLRRAVRRPRRAAARDLRDALGERLGAARKPAEAAEARLGGDAAGGRAEGGKGGGRGPRLGLIAPRPEEPARAGVSKDVDCHILRGPAHAGRLRMRGVATPSGEARRRPKLFPSFFQIYPNISLGISKLFQTFFLAF